jgi:hypothetical protein
MILGIISFVCFILGIVLCSYATERDISFIVDFGLVLVVIGFFGIIIFIGSNIDTIIKYFKI